MVPAYWCVHSHLMQPACVGLEVVLTQGPDHLSSPAAILLQASRMLELWFGAEAGPANIRKWLLVRHLNSCCNVVDCGSCFNTQHSVTNMHVHMHNPSSSFPMSVLEVVGSSAVAPPHPQVLSEGRDWQLLEPQLLTNKGYKLLQCCHTALEQLQRLLALNPSSVTDTSSSSSSSDRGSSRNSGSTSSNASSQDLEAAARRHMCAMCDGRLVPTPWLNEVRSMLVCLNQASS